MTKSPFPSPQRLVLICIAAVFAIIAIAVVPIRGQANSASHAAAGANLPSLPPA